MAPDSRSSVALSPFDRGTEPAWRRGLRAAVNAAAIVITIPCAIPVLLEQRLSNGGEGWFQFFAQVFAGVPGLPGVWLRRAYYWWTLEHCSLRVHIGYGALFAHRSARAFDHVYLGPYAVVGSADLGAWALLGTRCSVVSGGALHQADHAGRWLPANPAHARRIIVGAHAWIGEGAILMADVGRNAMVAAGAVVSSPVADGVMVGGNPARFMQAAPLAAIAAKR